jgi:FAD/FMN-containing dehydrogenase
MKTSTLDEAVGTLKSSLRGRVVTRADAGYDTARKVYNAMIDRHPAVIASCVDVADVQTALKFGRDHGLLIAVRSGGHNGGGLGTCDDGLVIDLSPMKGVHVDPAAGTVRVRAGCTWGDVDHAAHPFGLAVPAGIISTTGVGGLTLGGGVGHMTRACGLTIDNLLEAEVVLPDGRIVTTNSSQHPDLFWAIRGGGGNFGVVTSFLFRGHKVRTVCAGPMFWDIEHTTAVMQWYREFLPKAPETLNGFFAFLCVPPGPPFPEHLHRKKMCAVIWCYTGPQDQLDAALAPARKVAPLALEAVGPMPYPMMQSMFDPIYPPGDQWYWRADFVKELSDEAIKKHHEWGMRLPSLQSTMHLYPIDGAAHRPTNGDTPWAYRSAQWVEVMVGVDRDPANKDRITKWTKEYWEALHPYSAGGAYVNFMMDEGQERIRATYRDNYDRLAAIKKQYDPQNVLRVNQNIAPAA